MCIIIIVCKREREREGEGGRERKREKPILFLPVGHIGLAIVLSFEWGHP